MRLSYKIWILILNLMLCYEKYVNLAVQQQHALPGIPSIAWI